MKLLVMVR